MQRVHELRLRPPVQQHRRARSPCPPPAASSDDWGPANFDVRRRFNVSWSSSQLRNFNANLNFNASSAPPYTIRTGVDTNDDLLFNDRPDGVGRNTRARVRPVEHERLLHLPRPFGKPVEMPGGINFRSEGGALTATQGSRVERRPLPRVVQRERAEPHEPRQSHRLHRHPDVARFRPAVDDRRHPQGRFRDGAVVLM